MVPAMVTQIVAQALVLKMDILAGSYEASIPSTKGQCLIYLLHSKLDQDQDIVTGNAHVSS